MRGNCSIAKETGKEYFTVLIKDIHTPDNGNKEKSGGKEK